MALPLSYNVKNVSVRWKSTILAILGIALVVTVFVALSGLASGFLHALRATGRQDNAIIVQRGSATELTSLIPKEQENFLVVDDRIARDANGTPLASPEMVVVANLKHRKDGSPTNVTIRGVSPRAFEVRGGIAIAQGQGRRFTFGLDEIIVGERIASRVADLDVGGTIRMQKRDWKVTGIFNAEGGGFESEIWMDAKVLSQAFNRREMAQSITLRMKDPAQIPSFALELQSDPKVQVELKQEQAYYADQAGPVATNILALTLFVSIVMAIGAVFGGMNTMYAIVAGRTREIGTLRALGFSRRSILLSFLVESLYIALLGGVLGYLLSLPANGMSAAMGGPGFSEVAFAFRITPTDQAYGLAFAGIMGVLGGLLPAVRAARIPISSALKEA